MLLEIVRVVVIAALSVVRASVRTHLDMEERDGGRPLLARPLGLSGTRARGPVVL